MKSIGAFEKIGKEGNRVVVNLDLKPSLLSQSLRDSARSNFPRGTAYVEMWPALANYPPEGLVVPGDGHPNEVAHRVFADRLATELLRLLGRQNATMPNKVQAYRALSAQLSPARARP